MTRLDAVPNWSDLCEVVLAACDRPEADPLDDAALTRAVADCVLSVFPRPSATRCRALVQLAMLFTQTGTAEERAVLADPLRRLANAVRDLITDVAPAARERADLA